MRSIVPAHLRRVFESAGWSSARAEVAGELKLLDAVFAEIGGLRVGTEDTGLECARSEIEFEAVPFRDREVEVWEKLLRTDLFRLGVVSGGYATAHITADGRVFGLSAMHDAFYLHGESVEEALDSLLCGHRARPLFRPDQQQVWLYGIRYERSHPDAYRY